MTERARSPARGFGLLEAIVALALLAGTGMALFGWINQNLQTASRLRIQEQEAKLLLAAQALVDTVNPLEQPQGSLSGSSVRVQWQASPLEPPRANASFNPEVQGPWQVGLFRLDVLARDEALGIELRFDQWAVGTHRTQALETLVP